MAAKPAHVDRDTTILLDRLNDVRLARDWSYRQLAEDMARVTGFVISHATIQPLLSEAPPHRAKPYDRTLHKIRRYLETLSAEPTKQSRKGRAA